MEDRIPYGNHYLQYFIVYDFRKENAIMGNYSVTGKTVYTYKDAIGLVPGKYQKTNWNRIKDNDYILLISINPDNGDTCEFYTQIENESRA